MRRVRSSGTAPEEALATALRRSSLRFGRNCADLPGKPDFVLRKHRIAVFVDGELWHAFQWQQRGLCKIDDQFRGAENREYWTAKLRRNLARDFAQTAQLLRDGWAVFRFWASDVRDRAGDCAALIANACQANMSGSPASLLAAREVAEFFAGIGLARLGLGNAGWTVRFANDHSPEKAGFYFENFGEEQSHFDGRDIHEVRADDVPNVALATACFPCTDLSLAGAQRGLEAGTESSAYLAFTRLLREKAHQRPPLVLLENVVGMIHSRDGLDFTICLRELSEAGYTLDAFVLDAKWFVPQSRPRLFVVGVRDDFPKSAHHQLDEWGDSEDIRPRRLVEFIKAHAELPWSIRRLPRPEAKAPRLARILEDLSDSDPRWWTAPRADKLLRQMSDGHREKVEQMLRSKRRQYGTVFRRMRSGRSMAELRTDGLAGCLRTPKGGSARQILLRASSGKYAVRLLTPIECARLMGADTIRIPTATSTNAALFAFGDGVCVPAVQWIADHYLTPLATELLRGCVLRDPSAVRL